ncbi:MAG: uncharacterized protein A8A55_3091 [Amphiamblys sp. WSBS2006]|nr:MAG: uncharacterized protein A8A55_3091 [Amphiamblys sp. WSBS2006]
MKNIRLERCAIKLLPKLRLHEDSEIEELYLETGHEGYVSSILGAGDRSIWLGKVKSLKLKHCAVNLLPKLKLHEDNVMDVWLSGWWYGDISEILVKKDRTICVGRVKSLSLEFYAISILPKLKLHEDNVMEYFWLYAKEEIYVSKIFGAEDSSIWLGKVKKSLRLELYAISILPKLRLHEDNVLDSLQIVDVDSGMLQKDSWILNKIKTARSALGAFLIFETEEDPQTEPLLGPGMDGDGASGWKIKQIKMENSTVLALKGIRTDKSCVLDRFELTNPTKKDMNRVFEADERVYLGKIKQNGLAVPPSIEEALSYTLVDEEGNNLVS